MRLLRWTGEAIVLVAGLIALMLAEPVRSWVSDHGLLMYAAVMLLVAATLVLIEVWWSARSRYPRITERDRALFRRLEGEFPLDGEAMVYLDQAFNGKSWRWPPIQPVLTFAETWGHTAMFDDPVMNTALRKFHTTAHEFYNDAATESHIPDESEVGDRLARLNEGDYRPAYSPEWTATRDRLRNRAIAVVEAYRQLYLLGRQRGY